MIKIIALSVIMLTTVAHADGPLTVTCGNGNCPDYYGNVNSGGGTSPGTPKSGDWHLQGSSAISISTDGSALVITNRSFCLPGWVLVSVARGPVGETFVEKCAPAGALMGPEHEH